MTEWVEWDEESAHHIRTRSTRYPDAINIEPAWTDEVIHDFDCLVEDPDPHSIRTSSVRFTGWSVTARMVLTVVARRDRLTDTLYGRSAWKASGAALRRYLQGGTYD